MLRIPLLLLWCSLLVSITQAQSPPDILWEASHGGSSFEAPQDILVHPDGFLYIVGGTHSTNGDVVGSIDGFNGDVWLIKMDQNGNLIWQHPLGGTASDDGYNIDLARNSSNVIVTAGSSSSNGDVSSSNGSGDFWVIELDTSGTIVRESTGGNSDNNSARGGAVTANGDIIMGGIAFSFATFFDFEIMRFDDTGNLLWLNTYGGSSTERCLGTIACSAGGYLAFGQAQSVGSGDVSGGFGGSDFWVVRLDTAGNIIWEKSFGGTGSEGALEGIETSDGGFVFVGSTNSNNGQVTGFHGGTIDAWVTKIDSAGNLLWQRAFGGSDYDIAEAVCETSSGHILIGGLTYSVDGDFSGITPLGIGTGDAYVTELDAAGNILWTKRMGGSSEDRVYALSENSDGSIIAACETESVDGDVSSNNGFKDWWIVKLGQSKIELSVKAFLQGPYDTNTGLMNDDLRMQGLIPNTEPYSSLGFQLVGSPDTAITDPGVLSVSGNDAVVDWVLLELRSLTDSTIIVESAFGLLQRDGDVVHLDGSSPIPFDSPQGDYFLSLKHRNHLGIMTASTQFMGSSSSVDFSLSTTPNWGITAQTSVNGIQLLWSSNVVSDQQVKYAGSSNDRDPILVKIGGSVPTSTWIGYASEDTNLDGLVKYVGLNNDRDPILVNIGGNVPTAVRTEQLP